MQLDDDVPIGPRKRINRYAIMADMKVGQSFAFTSSEHRAVANHASILNTENRPDKQWFVSKSQLRCWRIK